MSDASESFRDPAHALHQAEGDETHEDPGEEWQKLDYDNMVKLARAAGLGIYRFADSAEAPHWYRKNPRTEPYIRAREKAAARPEVK